MLQADHTGLSKLSEFSLARVKHAGEHGDMGDDTLSMTRRSRPVECVRQGVTWLRTPASSASEPDAQVWHLW